MDSKVLGPETDLAGPLAPCALIRHSMHLKDNLLLLFGQSA